MAAIETYSTDGECTRCIRVFRNNLGSKEISLAKHYEDGEKAAKWLNKWQKANPNINDMEAAIAAYNDKYAAQEDKSRAILDFVKGFYQAFPKTEKICLLFIEMDDNIWKIVKGKDNAGKTATEADEKEFKEKSISYKANSVKFIKDNFKKSKDGCSTIFPE